MPRRQSDFESGAAGAEAAKLKKFSDATELKSSGSPTSADSHCASESSIMRSYRLESFGLTHIGRVRSNNEDCWKIFEEKQFYVLADGVGGHNAGEVASTIAVESLCASMQAIPEKSTVEEACLYLRRAVNTANTQILERAKSDPLCRGMGTTLSCYFILGQFLIYAHVGDSRLYRFRSELSQLTEDHSLRQQSRSGAAIATPRNIITRALGTSAIVHPDIGIISLDSNDIYLLCSDGLSDYVDEATLAQILCHHPHPLTQMSENLLNAALEKGGNDNITLLITKVCRNYTVCS